MNKELAEKYAQEWIAAWNSHDLEKILSHYEEGLKMSLPVITKLTGKPSGVLRGKQAVGNYWSGALEKYPDLEFKLLHLLRGANSVTIIYDSVLGLSAEVFHFGDSGKVAKAFVHYDL